MVRVKRGFTARRRKKKLWAKTKGFRITQRTQLRRAKQAVVKAGVHATRGRREKKGTMRRLWTTRINAAARLLGIKYNQLIHGLKLANIKLDRKVLADIALQDPQTFATIVNAAKKA
ncbi:MAG: 50S ribosomal protein L20 [Candidatus Margulisbacteria bacterium]|jgi:large subunit ribosomal protein L20|nr:50S ribosomal protein L20 [Candidatus Margulisiibacteriota bacterium]